MFDGSSVAFDKEAFENLNRIVNEIAGDGRLTVPGNLDVKGNVTVDGTTVFKNHVKLKNNKGMYVEGTGFVRFGNGEKEGNSADNNDGMITANKFSPGLNIVGIRKGSSTIRENQIWGNVTSFDNKKYKIGTLEVTGNSTLKNDCTINKKLTVKDISTFEKDCTLKKKLDVEGNCTINGNCTIKGQANMNGVAKVENKDVVTYDKYFNIYSKDIDSDDCGGGNGLIGKHNDSGGCNKVGWVNEEDKDNSSSQFKLIKR